MKIVVPTKRVIDTDQKVRALADGTGIDADQMPYVVNPFDAIALEEAVRIRDRIGGDCEIIAVGIGSDDYETELRTALAMGADRAIHVPTDSQFDPWNVSSVLLEIVNRESPDLVIMGKQAVDDDSNQAGQFLAARLGWPQATFASSVSIDGKQALVERETDAGIETIRVDLPAVITADLRLNEPGYASLPAIMRARKKPLDTVSLNELAVVPEPRVTVLNVRTQENVRHCQHVQTARELIERLQADEVLT